MTRYIRSLTLLPLAALLLSGCAETSRPEASGKGNIRGMNAVATAPSATFFIEERALGQLTYKQVSSMQQFDDLSYAFHFAARRPGDSAETRIVSRTLDVVPDKDYFFVLTGSVADPEMLLWETDAREWADDETEFEVAAAHLATGTGTVDVYFLPAGEDPVAGTALGTVSFGERLPNVTTGEGDYEFFVTAPGDPSTVLFESTSREYAARTSVLFTVQDADPSITSSLSVRRIDQSGSSAELAQRGAPPTQRFFHAAHGTGAVDVYVDEDFDAPLAANLAFGDLTADLNVPVASVAYTFTAAGNVGAVVLEEEQGSPATSRSTTFLVGEPGDLELATFVNDRRPVAGFGKLRINQVSANLERVDVYIYPAGTDIAERSPNVPQIASTFSSDYLHLPPDEYEVTVTETGEKSVLAGPVPLELAAGDVVEAAILDTADPNVLDVIVYGH